MASEVDSLLSNPPLSGVMECQFSSFTNSNMIRKDPIFKTLMLSRKGTVERPTDVTDPLRFAGEGVTFRAKLIGVLEVTAPRGDRLCQEALGELKMAIKAAGEHKQRIMICIALDGLRLRDERTGDCLYHHAVHKISFIAQDMADPRAFGYIFGSPDQGHRFFGIKTDKHANLVVIAMRDLFQVVYDLKKKDVEKNKYSTFDNGTSGSKKDYKNGMGHNKQSGSMDSLDQMLALGSHFRSPVEGSSASASAIQTADLLNLHTEDIGSSNSRSFDPFSSIGVNTNSKSSIVTAVPLPPPPSSTTSSTAHHPSPQLLSSKPVFAETFSDSFTSSSTQQRHFSPSLALPPPSKSPKTKAAPASSSGISHYSTIRPRKRSGGSNSSNSNDPCTSTTVCEPVVPALKFPNSTLRSPSLNRAVPRPGTVSAANSTSSSPRMVDSFDSLPFEVNFPSMTSTESSDSNTIVSFSSISSNTLAPSQSDRLQDLFTELDPLGTGRSKPYVDKKDFFQDLKKPTNCPMQQPPPSAALPAPNHAPSKRSMLSKQVTMSAVEEVMTDSYGREWHQPLAEDPFGSLHFVCPAVESGHSTANNDPFDTHFGKGSLFHQSNSLFHQSAATSPRSSRYSRISKTAINSMDEPGTAFKTNGSGRGSSLRVVLPPPSSSVAIQSDSDSEMTTLTQSRQPTNGSGSGLGWSPRLSPCVRLGAPSSLDSETKDSPVLPVASSSSEEDSSSSEAEPANNSHIDSAAVSSPPEPPPRPPIIRPPPLPPKGQPPLLPQRPVLTPTEELYYGTNSSGNKTPPLPIPIRKPKHHTPLVPSSSTSSDGSNYPLSLNQRSSPFHRAPKEEPISIANPPALPSPASKPNHQTPPPPRDLPPSSPSASQLNRISLMQLSSMSLGELAATLQLPPARLASMTLTELALRLAELNQQNEEQGRLSDGVPEGSISGRRSTGKKTSPRLSHPYYPPADEEDEDYEEDEEGDEDEEEDEEEEEEEVVALKIDEAEVCYKGGKKYEMLSDIRDNSSGAGSVNFRTNRVSGEESISPINNQVNKTIGREQQQQTTPTLASSTSESDRYAALREIMLQDLATVPEKANLEEKCQQKGILSTSSDTAGFEEDTMPSPPIVSTTPEFGFEDDFSRIQVFSAGNSVKTGKTTVASSDSAALYGVRPKTSALISKVNDGTKTVGSISSVDKIEAFDPFADEGTQPPRTNVDDVFKDEAQQQIFEEDEVDELADKFAAFETRFPSQSKLATVATTPDVGFQDSFADFHLSGSKCTPVPSTGNTFTADFDSAFSSSPPVLPSVVECDSTTTTRTKIKSAIVADKVKKSISVNIFKRVDDPFDDDFFQPEESSAPATDLSKSKSGTGAVLAAPAINTIVEDPFAWVQPFDDDAPTLHFDDEDPVNGSVGFSPS